MCVLLYSMMSESHGSKLPTNVEREEVTRSESLIKIDNQIEISRPEPGALYISAAIAVLESFNPETLRFDRGDDLLNFFKKLRGSGHKVLSRDGLIKYIQPPFSAESNILAGELRESIQSGKGVTIETKGPVYNMFNDKRGERFMLRIVCHQPSGDKEYRFYIDPILQAEDLVECGPDGSNAWQL